MTKEKMISGKSPNNGSGSARLYTAFLKAVENFDYTVLLSDLNAALRTNALDAGFESEAVYGSKEVLFYESLARPYRNGRYFDIQKLANQIYALGLSEELDLLVVQNAIKQAKNYPISINISAKSALCQNFWDRLIPLIALAEPKDIIFEILEHDVDPKADPTHLKALKAMGYRFALDDYAIGPEHERRLALLGDIVDFVKIDGAYLQHMYTHDPKRLKDFITDIKAKYPHVKLVAEHVKHFDQAQILLELGFDGVQGHGLFPEDYDAYILRQSAP